MIVAVQDANILIDLLKTGMLDSYFQLGVETYTTDLVLSEVQSNRRNLLDAYVESGKLKVKKFDGNELINLLSFKSNRSPALSLEDCSVFQFALEKAAMLLTGDFTLRKKAEAEQLKVCGILWVFDQLVEKGIWQRSVARAHLLELLKHNSRLPQTECKKRLKDWE